MAKSVVVKQSEEWFKGFFLKHVLVGLLVTIGGFVLWVTERKRPKDQRRTWVFVVAALIMVVGVVYGLGVGDMFLFGVLFDTLMGKNS